MAMNPSCVVDWRRFASDYFERRPGTGNGAAS
jgi:hypothetical protein